MTNEYEVEEMSRWDSPRREGDVTFTDGTVVYFEFLADDDVVFSNDRIGEGRRFRNNAFKRAVLEYVHRA